MQCSCMISLLILLYAFLCVVVLLGRFFEVLIGVRPEPLWSLLSKMGVLYALEPLFTVIFVINMNIVWEKVMSTLRAQIFGKLLIQKVKSNLYKLFFSFFSYLLECVDCLNYHIEDILLWLFNYMMYFLFMQVEFFDKYKVCICNHLNYMCYYFSIFFS
jgi:hypothetical protein